MNNRSFRPVSPFTADSSSPAQAPLAWLSAAVASNPCCIYVKDRAGHYVMANAAAAAALGLSTGELLGLTDLDLAGLGRMTAAEAALLAAGDEQVRATGQPLAAEECLTCAMQPHRYRSFKSPTLDTLHPGGVLGISIDITAEGGPPMPSTTEHHRAFFDACDDAVLVQDAEGVILDCNPAASAMYGYSRMELARLRATDLVPPSEHGRLQSWGALQQRTGSIFVQSFGVGRDGVIFPTEVSSRTIALGGETVVLVQVRNITDRRRLEEQLRQAHKMEAVGRLAGGIAHEFNNLLTVINGYSEFLLRSLDPAGETYLDIEQIYTAGRRAAELTRQLLAFSRRQALARPLVDVNAVISEMGDLLRSMASENVHLTIRLAPDLGLTRGDRGQIEQAIVHLAMNARDAMPHGGELTLCTANVTLRPGDHVSHLDPRPGEYICLAVGDTGVGMPAEVCEHLFEPFFTTKEVGQGTGLGLAMIYGVIDDLGGAIDVCSEPGRGSTFRLYLPRAAMPAGEPALEGDALPRGHETVLVVEDEDAPRRRLARLLCRLGYTVLEAANCIEALRAAGGHAAPIDLVIAAQRLPDASGLEVIAQIRALHARLPAILMAAARAEPGAELAAGEDIPVMHYPFTMDAAARQVRHVLNAARRPPAARFGPDRAAGPAAPP